MIEVAPLKPMLPLATICYIAANQELFEWTTGKSTTPTNTATILPRTHILRAQKYACDGQDPHRGGGRRPCTVAAFTLDDHASADEADPGDDALDDPAGRCKLITAASGF